MNFSITGNEMVALNRLYKLCNEKGAKVEISVESQAIETIDDELKEIIVENLKEQSKEEVLIDFDYVGIFGTKEIILIGILDDKENFKYVCIETTSCRLEHEDFYCSEYDQEGTIYINYQTEKIEGFEGVKVTNSVTHPYRQGVLIGCLCNYVGALYGEEEIFSGLSY